MWREKLELERIKKVINEVQIKNIEKVKRDVDRENKVKNVKTKSRKRNYWIYLHQSNKKSSI